VGEAVNDEIGALRAAIDANDRIVVAAVNERLRLVTELWRLKRELGIDRLDRNREQSLRAELAATNEGPLSATGLDHLMGELLALTKREVEANDQDRV
jgi:chorismate mutase